MISAAPIEIVATTSASLMCMPNTTASRRAASADLDRMRRAGRPWPRTRTSSAGDRRSSNSLSARPRTAGRAARAARDQVHREVALLLGRERRGEHRDRERAAAHDRVPPPAEVVGRELVVDRGERRDEHDEREQAEHQALFAEADVVDRSCAASPTAGVVRELRRLRHRSSGGYRAPADHPRRSPLLSELTLPDQASHHPRALHSRGHRRLYFLCFARYSSRYLRTMSSSSFE